MEELPRDRARPLTPRAATRDDLEALTALWLDLAAHHARRNPLYELRDGAEVEARRLLVAQLGDPDAAFFICAAGEVVPPGLVGFCAVRVDRAPPIQLETRRAEITDLWVAPSARRAGAGHRLVDAALDWVRDRGVSRVEVRVASENSEGQGFWRAIGFADFMDVLHHRL